MAFIDQLNNVSLTLADKKVDKLLLVLDAAESEALRQLLENPALPASRMVRIIRQEGEAQTALPKSLFSVSDKTVSRWREDNKVSRTVNGL